MAANTLPDNKKRDAITAPDATASTAKRADLLNGSPRTKSLSEGGPNFSDLAPTDHQAPPPNNPYR